jgi:hypothetical protein
MDGLETMQKEVAMLQMYEWLQYPYLQGQTEECKEHP